LSDGGSLGEPEHLLFIQERGGVGCSSSLGEAASPEDTHVAVLGGWHRDTETLQPHHLLELHGSPGSSRGGGSGSAHLGRAREESKAWVVAVEVCIVGDRTGWLVSRCKMEREKVAVLL
jgi:hypothetical protein